VSSPIDWSKSHSWQFDPLDENVFSAVKLARQAGKLGKSYPDVYNASNEQAVAAFHAGLISFDQITELIERAVDAHEPDSHLSLESVLEAESWSRDLVGSLISNSAD
jgi:1-deoxy-D-xylulose-5-phosphate reductoisomerase